MSKYIYPAVFTPEDGGGYSILFPDLESCYTCGDDLSDGYTMAEDVLSLTLYRLEADGKEIPVPSNLQEVSHTPNEFVSLVAGDTIEYRKRHNNKAVKRTLSLPAWLDEMATENGISLSRTLQDALADRLRIDR